jgi:large subunit ribosomal protein L30
MKIKLLRSFIGLTPAQRKTLRALGLKKVNQVREVADNPCMQGMVNKVKHFVEVSK